jgi:alkanesulfonate monooxygenase SsuD/methylene tetrahydromethanopterin reductase-like flavin-dependent oxidoreductase (luciferase family)
MRALYPASGISPSSRGARFDEMVDLMRRPWTEATVTFHGRFSDLDQASMEPKPVQKPHPPIWFGGHGEAALARAVRA